MIRDYGHFYQTGKNYIDFHIFLDLCQSRDSVRILKAVWENLLTTKNRVLGRVFWEELLEFAVWFFQAALSIAILRSLRANNLLEEYQ